MNSTASQDRRTLCRIPLQLSMELLTYNGSRQSHKAMSVNLHYRGAEIVTDAELQKGTTVTLRLSKIPGNPQTDSTQGIIRWAYNAPNRYKYGIAFRQDCRWFFLLTQQQLLNVQKDDSSLASSVLNALDQGVLSVNKHWQITLFNKAAEHITGWQQDEVLGKNVMLFFHLTSVMTVFLPRISVKASLLLNKHFLPQPGRGIGYSSKSAQPHF